jgi:hypothetical protein
MTATVASEVARQKGRGENPETWFVLRPTTVAMNAPQLQGDDFECWQDLKKNVRPDQR